MTTRKRQTISSLIAVVPELEQAKNSVLYTLESIQSRRSSEYALTEFINW
jgi:hypothetical protein